MRLVGHHVDPTEVARRLNRPLGSLPSHPQLGAAGVACYESLPVLERIAAPEQWQAGFQVPLRDLTPGITLAADRVDPLNFGGAKFEWPMLDIDRLREGNWQFGTQAYHGHPIRAEVEALNRRLADPVAGVKAAQGEQTHASRTELGPLGTPDRRFSELVPDLPPPARTDDPPRPVLQTHDAAQRYGSLDAGLNLPEGISAADNVTNSPLALVSHGGFSRAFLGVFPQKLPDGSAEFNSWFRIPLGSLASKRLDDPRALDSYPIPGMTVESLVFVKNRRGQGLQQAVAELPPTQDGTRAFLRAVIDGDPADPAGGRLIDGDLLQPDWTGLVVLRPGFQTLLAGLDGLIAKFVAEPMQYVAITAKVDGASPQYPTLYGTYRYTDEAPELPESITGAAGNDVDWDLNVLDIRFRDREIVRFELSGTLILRKFLRIVAFDKPKKFIVRARYQSASDQNNPTHLPRILFEGAPSEPVTLNVDIGPVKAANFKAVRVFLEGLNADEAGNSKTSSRFELDGDLTMQKWDILSGFLSIDESKPVPFSKLGLPLPIGEFRLSWDYPSVEFPLKQREPIRLGPIQFRFTRVGIGGPDLLADTVRLVAGDIQSPRCPFAAVQVDLFKYPELSPNAGKSLSFELVAAFDGDGKKTKLGLRGLDFKKLDIDLFRFMRLRIDEIEQSHKNHNNYLGLNGIKLEILGRTILENLFVAFFDAAGRRGSPRTSGGRSRGRRTPSSRRSRRGSRSSRACSSSTGSWSRTTSSSTRPRPSS